MKDKEKLNNTNTEEKICPIKRIKAGVVKRIKTDAVVRFVDKSTDEVSVLNKHQKQLSNQGAISTEECIKGTLCGNVEMRENVDLDILKKQNRESSQTSFTQDFLNIKRQGENQENPTLHCPVAHRDFKSLYMTRREISIDENLLLVESDSTYVQQVGSMKLLFSGRIKIEKKLIEIHEQFDTDGKVTGIDEVLNFLVCLTLERKQWRRVLSLEKLQSGEFLSKLSGGLTFLEPGSDVKYFYKRLITEKIKAEDYKTDCVFDKPGWKKDPFTRCFMYVTPRGVIGRPGYQYCSKKDRIFGVKDMLYFGESATAEYLQMREVLGKNQDVAIMLQYFFITSLLKGLLNDKGINPQFIVALIGPTNSKKTTMAKLFMKLYERNSGVDINFQATEVALEEAATKNPDAITIFDDIVPPKDRFAAKTQEKQVERIIRDFGDNLPRIRSDEYLINHPEASKFAPILSSALLTGEVFPVTTPSSRTRILKLEISSDDCDVEALTKHQSKLEVLPAFTEEFLTFVTLNQAELLKMAKEYFFKIRNRNPLELKVPRFTETFALFIAMTEIFRGYLKTKFNEDEVNHLIQNDQAAIARIIQANDSEGTPVSEETIIAEIVQDDRLLHLKDADLDVLHATFEKSGFIAAYPQHLMKIVTDAYAKRGKYFSFASVTELTKFLTKSGLIKVSADGRGPRKILSDKEYKNHRFYCFFKDKLESLTNEI